MHITGAQHLDALISCKAHDLKMVFNASGAILFQSSRQHREMKGEGISYEDNYAGNALVAMVRRDAIEIRFHQKFADTQVATIVAALLALPEFAPLVSAAATYQGRVIAV